MTAVPPWSDDGPFSVTLLARQNATDVPDDLEQLRDKRIPARLWVTGIPRAAPTLLIGPF